MAAHWLTYQDWADRLEALRRGTIDEAEIASLWRTFLAQLRDGHRSAAVEANQGLGYILHFSDFSPTHDDLSTLWGLRDNAEEFVRWASAGLLAQAALRMGVPELRETVAHLMDLVKKAGGDQRATVMGNIAALLPQLSTAEADGAAEVVLRVARDEGWMIKHHAAKQIGAIASLMSAPARERAAQVIAEFLNDDEPSTRAYAISGLLSLADQDRPGVSVDSLAGHLLAQARHEDPDLARSGVWGLATLHGRCSGQRKGQLWACLEASAHSSHNSVRLAAAGAAFEIARRGEVATNEIPQALHHVKVRQEEVIAKAHAERLADFGGPPTSAMHDAAKGLTSGWLSTATGTTKRIASNPERKLDSVQMGIFLEALGSLFARDWTFRNAPSFMEDARIEVERALEQIAPLLADPDGLVVASMSRGIERRAEGLLATLKDWELELRAGQLGGIWDWYDFDPEVTSVFGGFGESLEGARKLGIPLAPPAIRATATLDAYARRVLPYMFGSFIEADNFAMSNPMASPEGFWWDKPETCKWPPRPAEPVANILAVFSAPTDDARP